MAVRTAAAFNWRGLNGCASNYTGVAGQLGLYSHRLRHIRRSAARWQCNGERADCGRRSAGQPGHHRAHHRRRAALRRTHAACRGGNESAWTNGAASASTQPTTRSSFRGFDVGALLKMAHVPGLSGESALAGTMTRVRTAEAATWTSCAAKPFECSGGDARRRASAQRGRRRTRRWPTHALTSTRCM